MLPQYFSFNIISVALDKRYSINLQFEITSNLCFGGFSDNGGCQL